ncbi:hypothetical protein LX32DRAFT_695158 [Colletotrichum zoysiae]|uniref:Zn(2)-C6 fungal-type domain-containing protein n=1 Tax=Colletotrichum zoysiae TaxID=1216348 RepID=A0AAD9M351_9PEZI|nr:hypothetical protein LX32DRAFT_695158 [Colletotrichum zoysiae]
MVGVPGRSKGCNTCRKRKKGCDLQRPSCGQCQKAGIQCAGYERKRIFVNVTNPGASNDAKAMVSVARTIHQPPSLSQSAFEEKIFDLFWDGYMPEAPLYVPGSTVVRYSNADWATAGRYLYRSDAALRQSLLALSLGTIGRRDKQQWMIDDGLKFYCGALSELNVALRHPKRWKTDALMLASRLLGFYELLYGADDRERYGISQAQSWEGHTLGEMALVLQRTPEAHVQGTAHDLFSSGRIHLIVVHIRRRQRCPLSHPIWKTVPWRDVPKTPKDFLVDIFADVPGLLEDLDRVRTCNDEFEKESRRARLIEECWRIDGELTWWLESLSPKRELEELMARGLDNPSACDVAVASNMTLCWAVALLSYSTLRLAIGKGGGVELPERTDPFVYCTKIANIADVFFHPSAGTFGIQSAPFPIGMALVYLNSFEEGFNSETKWKLFSFFGRTASNGISIGKFLLSTQRAGLVSKTITPITPDGIKTKARGWIGTAV